jgi:hypothetical protein
MTRGDTGGVLGEAGGWARVKSGFVFPILTHQVYDDLTLVVVSNREWGWAHPVVRSWRVPRPKGAGVACGMGEATRAWTMPEQHLTVVQMSREQTAGGADDVLRQDSLGGQDIWTDALCTRHRRRSVVSRGLKTCDWSPPSSDGKRLALVE